MTWKDFCFETIGWYGYPFVRDLRVPYLRHNNLQFGFFQHNFSGYTVVGIKSQIFQLSGFLNPDNL